MSEELTGKRVVFIGGTSESSFITGIDPLVDLLLNAGFASC